MAAIYAIFEPNILGFQFFFSGLTAEPTNRPPVRDYDPDTPLRVRVQIWLYWFGSSALRVSGVTAYKFTISLRKLKLAEDCFHSDQWDYSRLHNSVNTENSFFGHDVTCLPKKDIFPQPDVANRGSGIWIMTLGTVKVELHILWWVSSRNESMLILG